MKKLFIAILIIGAIAGIVLYLNRNTSKSQTAAVKEETVVNQVTGSSSSSSTTSLIIGSAITTTYTPAPIGNSISEELDITMTGLLLANHYDFEILTDLTSYPGIELDVKKIGADKARLTIKNINSTTVTLPTLTISALKLN